MSKKIVIIGASGHGKVVADIARRNGYDDIKFLDDNAEVRMCGGYPVIGKCCDAQNMDTDVIVAIGNAGIRQRIQGTLIQNHLVTLIHPNAVVAEDVVIGEGSVVMAGVVINPGTVIGRGCIINTCSSIDHDCRVGDFVHVSVGSHLCGTVVVENGTWIGAGATVNNNISICSNSMIGAGAVVVKNIEKKGTYVCVPAKKIR